MSATEGKEMVRAPMVKRSREGKYLELIRQCVRLVVNHGGRLRDLRGDDADCPHCGEHMFFRHVDMKSAMEHMEYTVVLECANCFATVTTEEMYRQEGHVF